MMAAARVFGGCRPLMAAVKSAAAGVSGGSAAPASRRKAKAGPNVGGLMRMVPVSPAMRKFLGVPEISRRRPSRRSGTTSNSINCRYEVVHSYRENEELNEGDDDDGAFAAVQNPANKREIYCDERLKAIFDGKDKVGMLEIAKLIAPHFGKAD